MPHTRRSKMVIVKKRIEHILKLDPEIPKNVLAERLSIPNGTLFRLINDLKKEGRLGLLIE